MEDFNAFQLFKAVVDQGSMASAAEKLGMNRNSVSLRLKSLEKRLGVKLLERTTRSLRLTPAGKIYYERYGRAFAELQAARAALRGDEPKGSPKLIGSLKVSAPPLLGARLLSPLLAELLLAHPALEVELSSQEEGSDLVIKRGAPAAGAKKLLESPRLLLASPAYLARAGRPGSLSELEQHRCLVQRGRERFTLSGPKGEESLSPKSSLRVEREEMLPGALLVGLGIGLLPRMLVASELASGALEPVLPELRGEPEILSAQAAPTPSPFAVELLLRFLAERLSRA